VIKDKGSILIDWKWDSSLLNILPTILKFVSLQIRNSPPAADQTAEFAAVPLDKNCNRKILVRTQNPIPNSFEGII